MLVTACVCEDACPPCGVPSDCPWGAQACQGPSLSAVTSAGNGPTRRDAGPTALLGPAAAWRMPVPPASALPHCRACEAVGNLACLSLSCSFKPMSASSSVLLSHESLLPSAGSSALLVACWCLLSALGCNQRGQQVARCALPSWTWLGHVSFVCGGACACYREHVPPAALQLT